MSLDLFDRSIFEIVNKRAESLEDRLSADVLFYSGGIQPNFFRSFRDYVEEMRARSPRTDGAVAVFIRTGGGSAETAERMVAVLRKHYGLVYFVVPDLSMSAGTILCMSGDKIYMDYSSSLGPIDPQVPAPDTGEYVPAMGYLDKVKEITEKGDLAPADVVLLRSMDLGKLALFEQARDLSKDLLKKWLVEFKFKDWTHHRTNNVGATVSLAEKQARADEIATALGNHTLWRSHGRSIDLPKLAAMRIQIDDYSDDKDFRTLIREYNDPLTGFIDRMGYGFFMHNHRVGL